MTGRARRGADRGASAVEFALVLPVLLIIVFGVIDFGRMLNAQITLTEAAREGSRAESLGADPEARAALVGDLDGMDVDVTACPSPSGADDTTTVITSYPFEFVTPVGDIAALLGGSGYGTVTLTGRGVMPCLS